MINQKRGDKVDKNKIIERLKDRLEDKSAGFEVALLLIWLRNEIDGQSLGNFIGFRNILAHGAELLDQESREQFVLRLKEDIDLSDLESFFLGARMTEKGGIKISKDPKRDQENLESIERLLREGGDPFEILYRIVVYYESTQKIGSRELRHQIVHPEGVEIELVVSSLIQSAKILPWARWLLGEMTDEDWIQSYESLRRQEDSLHARFQYLRKHCPKYVDPKWDLVPREHWVDLRPQDQLKARGLDLDVLSKKVSILESLLNAQFERSVREKMETRELVVEKSIKGLLEVGFPWGSLIMNPKVDTREIIAFFKQNPQVSLSQEEFKALLMRLAQLQDIASDGKLMASLKSCLEKKVHYPYFMGLWSQSALHMEDDDFVEYFVGYPSGLPIVLCFGESVKMPESDEKIFVDALVEYPIFFHPRADLEAVAGLISRLRGYSIPAVKDRLLAGAIGCKSIFVKGGLRAICFGKILDCLMNKIGRLWVMEKEDSLYNSRPLSRLMELSRETKLSQTGMAGQVFQYILDMESPVEIQDDFENIDVAKGIMVVKIGKDEFKCMVPSHLSWCFLLSSQIEIEDHGAMGRLAVLNSAAFLTYLHHPGLYRQYILGEYNVMLFQYLWNVHLKTHHPKEATMPAMGSDFRLTDFPEYVREMYRKRKLSPCLTDLPTLYRLLNEKFSDLDVELSVRHYLWALQMVRLHVVELDEIVQWLKTKAICDASKIKGVFTFACRMFSVDIDLLFKAGSSPYLVFKAYAQFIQESFKAYGVSIDKGFEAIRPDPSDVLAVEIPECLSKEIELKRSDIMEYRFKAGEASAPSLDEKQLQSLSPGDRQDAEIGHRVLKKTLGTILQNLTEISKASFWVDNPEGLSKRYSELMKYEPLEHFWSQEVMKKKGRKGLGKR